MMALLERSLNVQDGEASGRKRSHDEFTGQIVKLEGGIEPCENHESVHVSPLQDNSLDSDASSALSSAVGSPIFTEAGSSTPARNSPDIQTPTKSATLHDWATSAKPRVADKTQVHNCNLPTKDSGKRKKLSPSEKEVREREIVARLMEKKLKEKEKGAQLAEKAAERARKEEEKGAQLAEKAAEKARKEEEKEAQLAEKAAKKARKEEEKAALIREREEKRKEKEDEKRIKAEERDEKKRKKEEEQACIQEEKDKKQRSQMKLATFFGKTEAPKKQAEGVVGTDHQEKAIASPTKAKKTHYQHIFKPFFVKENTSWIKTAIEMDEETKQAKSKIIDEAIAGQRARDVQFGDFDAVQLLNLPSKPYRRGCLHEPVKHIMEKMYQEAEANDHRNPDDAARIRTDAKRSLSRVPFKMIAFSRDVRPPYYGTVSFKPFALGKGHMTRLARRSMARRLPLDYEYDSEAEWQDEEEGEDLDAEDEEEELEEEDDMDGFLDDSEDVNLHRRLFASNLEVENTGICYENDRVSSINMITSNHKLEIMHEGLPHSWGIDPFSTQYWEPEARKQRQQTKSSTGALEKESKMAPPPPPANAFAALGGESGSMPAPAPEKLVKSEILNELKQLIIENKAMSKTGIIEVLFTKLRSQASRIEVKNTVEHVAERVGSGRQKAWELRKGHEISI